MIKNFQKFFIFFWYQKKSKKKSQKSKKILKKKWSIFEIFFEIFFGSKKNQIFLKIVDHQKKNFFFRSWKKIEI